MTDAATDEDGNDGEGENDKREQTLKLCDEA